jgi:cytoskeletal protein RodZ
MENQGEMRKEKLLAMGQELQSRREELGLTLEEVRARTRMNPKYLRAIENGEEAIIPGPTYYRAFLKSYATFLGLDGTHYSKRYKDLDEPAPSPTTRPNNRPSPRARARRRKNNTAPWLLGIALVIAIAGTFIFFVRDSGEPTTGNTPANTVPNTDPEETQSPNDPTTGSPETPSQSTEPNILRSDPNDTETIFTLDETPFQVVVLTQDEPEGYSWISVTVDGEKAYEGMLQVDSSLSFEGSSEIVVKAGRPWSIYFEALGIDLGVGGVLGPVKDITFRYAED